MLTDWLGVGRIGDDAQLFNAGSQDFLDDDLKSGLDVAIDINERKQLFLDRVGSRGYWRGPASCPL